MQHVHPRTGAGQLIGQLPRAVRRAVVHDEHLEPRILRQHLRHKLREFGIAFEKIPTDRPDPPDE